MKKVIKGESKVNELMRSYIEERIKDISVEAFQDPPVVKYYLPSTLHNMTLSDECLDRIKDISKLLFQCLIMVGWG